MPERATSRTVTVTGHYRRENIVAIYEWAISAIEQRQADQGSPELDALRELEDWCRVWIENDPRDNGGDGYARRQMRSEWPAILSGYRQLAASAQHPTGAGEPRVVEVEDQGMWRGRHTWRVVMEDADGRSSVNAHGDTEAQALAHAQTTFANRHRWTVEQRAAFKRNAQAFGRSFGDGQ